jgi:hypothetical protein
MSSAKLQQNPNREARSVDGCVNRFEPLDGKYFQGYKLGANVRSVTKGKVTLDLDSTFLEAAQVLLAAPAPAPNVDRSSRTLDLQRPVNPLGLFPAATHGARTPASRSSPSAPARVSITIV